MMGRMLFVAVWLIIAAGLLLPAYAPEGDGAGPAPTASGLRVAMAAHPDCQDCVPVGADQAICQAPCACDQALARAAGPTSDSAGQISYLVVQPRPADRSSGPQPVRLPAI